MNKYLRNFYKKYFQKTLLILSKVLDTIKCK